MGELLMAYLEITREIESLDWAIEIDHLEYLLEMRNQIIVDLEPYTQDNRLNEQKDPEIAVIVDEIEKLEKSLVDRFETQLTHLTDQIQGVRQEQANHGKNKLAYQRYFSKQSEQPSVFFDQKK